MRKTIIVLASLCLVALVLYFFKAGESPEPAPAVASSVEQPKAPDTSTSLDGPRADHSDKNDPGQEVLKPEQTVTTDSGPELEPEIREALEKTLNTSSEGLVEEPTAQGAIRLNHQGHFQTAPVATIDPEGNVQIRDYSSLPATANQK